MTSPVMIFVWYFVPIFSMCLITSCILFAENKSDRRFIITNTVASFSIILIFGVVLLLLNEIFYDTSYSTLHPLSSGQHKHGTTFFANYNSLNDNQNIYSDPVISILMIISISLIFLSIKLINNLRYNKLKHPFLEPIVALAVGLVASIIYITCYTPTASALWIFAIVEIAAVFLIRKLKKMP